MSGPAGGSSSRGATLPLGPLVAGPPALAAGRSRPDDEPMESYDRAGLVAGLAFGGAALAAVMVVAILAGWGGVLVAVLVVLGMASAVAWGAQLPPAGGSARAPR